jgi:hypothetical protein
MSTLTAPLQTRWTAPGVEQLGRASELHFAPAEGAVLDLGSLDSLVWADHDSAWLTLASADGLPGGLALEGLDLLRSETDTGVVHFVSPGRCLVPLQGTGRLVLAELRERVRVSMEVGVLVLRGVPKRIRAAGVQAAAQEVELRPVVVGRLKDVEAEDLVLEYNWPDPGQHRYIRSYRDLRRLDPPNHDRVQDHLKVYDKMLEEVCKASGEAMATNVQATEDLPPTSAAWIIAALEAAASRLASGPSTSATRIRLHDRVRSVLDRVDDKSRDESKTRSLKKALDQLNCHQDPVRILAGVR